MTSPIVARWWSLAETLPHHNHEWLKVAINDNTATCTVESSEAWFEVVKRSDGSATVTTESISSMYVLLTELHDEIDNLVIDQIVNTNTANVSEEVDRHTNALNSKLAEINQAIVDVLLYKAPKKGRLGPLVLENGQGCSVVDTLLQALMPPAISEVLGVVMEDSADVIEVDATLRAPMMRNYF